MAALAAPAVAAVAAGIEATVASTIPKWTNYWAVAGDATLPPWDADAPCSFLKRYVDGTLAETGARASLAALASAFAQAEATAALSAVELGCGSGASAVYLAGQAGIGHVTAVDIVPAALDLGKARALAAGLAVSNRMSWVCADAFKFAPADKFHLMFDLQCFHCLRGVQEEAIVRKMASLLHPGGVLLVITGNATADPERPTPTGTKGPSMLTRDELVDPFVRPGLFSLIAVTESRFDTTPTYGSTPPKCWVGLFERSAAVAAE